MAIPRRPSIMRCLVWLSLLCAGFANPAFAQSWSSDGKVAGFSVEGRYSGLSFQCLGASRLQMLFSGFDQRLQPGQPYTVALTIDGTSALYQARATPEGTALAVEQTAPDLAPVIERLRKGKAAEVSGPAGRYTVPLRGSGVALKDFAATCG